MNWNIVGHEWAVTLLRNHIEQGQMRHAYLFTGPPAVGRRTLALRFSQALNCSDPPSPGEYCGECRLCKHFDRMQQADLSIVVPEDDSSSIKVDQIRNLQHSLSLSPYEARYRIALLPDFQRATASAQNALLKTLEEAPAKVILMLTADSAENLLPTIVSRCEIIRLRPMAIGKLDAELQEKWTMSADQAKMLAHISSGRVGYALNMATDDEQLDLRNEWIEDLLRLSVSSRRERFQYADMFRRRESREKAAYILKAWLLFWRDVFMLAAGARVPLVNLRWEEQAKDLASKYELAQLRKIIADLEEGLSKLEKTNVNSRLLFEVLLLDWPLLR